VKRRATPRAVLVYAGVGSIALLFIGTREGGLASLALAGDGVGIVPAALIGLGGGAAFALLSGFLRPFRPFRRIEAVVRLIFPSLRAVEIAVLAAASAVAEEMLFRAALQPAVGLVPASLIFGACHFNRRLLVWPLWAALAGLGFGWLFEATGGVLAPIVAHATINAIGFARVGARAARRRGIRSKPDDGAATDG